MDSEIIENLQDILGIQLAKLKKIKPNSKGYVCEDKNITELSLSGCGLEEFPQYINSLKSLRYLSLRNNLLKEIPDSFKEFISLEKLDLYDNNLSSLPNSIQELKSLLWLDLSKNQFADIPEPILNLKSLQVLLIGGNYLITLPESLSNLTDLQQLYLRNNRFISFPESITNLSRLEYLNLSYNQISEIPESIGKLKNLIALALDNNKIKELKNLQDLIKLDRLYLHHNDLSEDEKKYLDKEIDDVRKYCKEIKEDPKRKYENVRKNALSYKRKIDNIRNTYTPEKFEEFEKNFLNLGSWREKKTLRKLKELQTYWFRENNKYKHVKFLNNTLDSNTIIKIFMVQLHALKTHFSFTPNESKLAKFKRFKEDFYIHDEKIVLKYNSIDELSNEELNKKEKTKKKINKILNLILCDTNKNKLIIFPETTLPHDFIDEIQSKISSHLESHENENIVFIGGIEHQIDPNNKNDFFSHINKAVLIDKKKEQVFQTKQTPVVIYDKDEDLREGIKCEYFPRIKLFDTTFGRIAIFICRDFLRLSDAIAQWAMENEVEFIIIPSLSGKVLPFYYRVFNIYNQQSLKQLKIIYVNVGEFGASELFSVATNTNIEFGFQKNERDNVGEVIVTRVCQLYEKEE